jgi:hypothetical protein
MPPVGDLHGLGRPFSGCFGKNRVAVPGNDFHFWVLFKPCFYGLCLRIGQEFNWSTRLEIHYDGSVRLSLSDCLDLMLRIIGPFIYSHYFRFGIRIDSWCLTAQVQ